MLVSRLLARIKNFSQIKIAIYREDIIMDIKKKSKKRIIAVQADPLSTFVLETDSTTLIAKAFESRGYSIFFYEPKNLSLWGTEVIAYGTFVRSSTHDSKKFDLVSEETLNLEDVVAVLIRQNPPFDINYINNTYILDLLKGRTIVSNDPSAIRNYPEKFFPFLFHDLLPPSLMTQNKDDAALFLSEHKQIILKPFGYYGGRDVIKLTIDDSNLEFILDSYFNKHNWVVVQRFLQEVYSKDKRLIFVDGKLVGALGRIPAIGDFRTNISHGAKNVVTHISAREQVLADLLSETFTQHNILLACVDMIDEYLIEVNITSPSTLTVFNEIYGARVQDLLVDAIEKRLQNDYVIGSAQS